MTKILITGSSGFLGTLLTDSFRAKRIAYVPTDKISPKNKSESETFVQGNLCSPEFTDNLFKNESFETVIHLASELDFAVTSQKSLFDNNVKTTKNILAASLKYGVKRIIFTSSNSAYLGNSNTFGITESVKPVPLDPYGASKVESEHILNEAKDKIHIINVRPPNIIDAGRIGMLSILFELLESNSTLWTVGDGSLRYQCIYAQDLLDVLHKLLSYEKSDTFNIGSDRVPSFKEMYQDLARTTSSKSKIRSIPALLSLPPLKLFYHLGLSPMGPYQFRMLTRNFIFDTTHVKKELNWQPTLNNTEMLKLAYDFFVANKQLVKSGKLSANSSAVKMGILNVLKYLP